MIKLLVLGGVLAAGLSAYGGGSSGTTGTTGSGGLAAASSRAVLAPAHTALGTVLVDHAGRTVYLLTADPPHRSSCTAQCLTYWPPVAPRSRTTSLPGISARIGATKVAGGGRTVTVGRWPVYTFVSDSAPGDVKGEGVKTFGGVWYAVSPSGHPVKPGSKAAGTSTSSGTSSGGGGY
jgi:predicted lipoprotein with Yx(FWY)xxD motif